MSQLSFPEDIDSVQALCTTQMNVARTPLVESVQLQRKDHVYSLGLGLSSRCNFHCPMCYYHGVDDSTSATKHIHDMPLPLLKTILVDLPILARIVIGLEGEPFCYPHLFQALDCMRPKTDSFTLVSNGSLLTEEHCRRLATYPISLLSLSIDAADKASYARFRTGGDLVTFKKHAAQAVRYFEKVICLHTVIFAENSHTVPDIPKLAAEIGVQRLTLQQVRLHRGAQKRGIHPASTATLRQCLAETICNAQHYGITVHISSFFADVASMAFLRKLTTEYSCLSIDNRQDEPQYPQCAYLQQFTSLLSDGRLFPCCGDFTPAQVKDYSFDNIFNHPYLQNLRTLHNLGKLPEPCLRCRYECPTPLYSRQNERV